MAWPALRQRRLRPWQRLAGRDAQLRVHQVDAGDRLRDRVLDLQPRVHLEEVEARLVALAFEEELDGAGVAVAGGPRRGHSCFPMRARSAGVSAGEGLSSMTF